MNEKKEKIILVSALAAGVALGAVFNIWFKVIKVSGRSMENTYKDGETVIIRKNAELERSDVVVIDKDGADGRNLIKRVIAVGGDELNINFETHEVTVNGTVIDEPYIKEPTSDNAGAFEYPVTVPENCYFVMGDNRNESIDSRNPKVGFVSYDNILGKVIFKLS